MGFRHFLINMNNFFYIKILIFYFKAFSMVIPQKRLWFIFTDSTCELVAYLNEDSFLLKKKEFDRIDLSRSAIVPMNSSLCLFKIL